MNLRSKNMKFILKILKKNCIKCTTKLSTIKGKSEYRNRFQLNNRQKLIMIFTSKRNTKKWLSSNIKCGRTILNDCMILQTEFNNYHCQQQMVKHNQQPNKQQLINQPIKEINQPIKEKVVLHKKQARIIIQRRELLQRRRNDISLL